MRSTGCDPEDFEDEFAPVEVWPENWPIFGLFRRLQSQWHTGMAGATGLQYASAYPLLDRTFPEQADWDEAFEQLRVMESAALAEMSQDKPSPEPTPEPE